MRTWARLASDADARALASVAAAEEGEAAIAALRELLREGVRNVQVTTTVFEAAASQGINLEALYSRHLTS